MQTRCAWVNSDPLYLKYHDQEWGVPIYDERRLFEFLILEGMQAGLSWFTVLKKRDNFRQSFANFEMKELACFGEKEVEALMDNSGIIRNRLKIQSAIINAKMALKIKEEKGSLSDYLWSFVNGQPIKNHWQSINEVPAHSPVSDAMSKDLKKEGFKFVGTTICYAFMQAVGMVNDHTTDCFCYHKD